MSLRKKTLIWVGVVFTLLIVILQIVSYLTVSAGFKNLERDQAYSEIEHVNNVLSYEISNLDMTNTDWSAWTETYNFVKTGDTTYLDNNMMDNTFVNLNINIILLVKPSGDIIFGKAYDLEQESAVPLPESIKEYLIGGNILVQHPNTDSYVTGILSMPDSPLLVSSRPVLTSERKGPIQGTMIMGRYLDDMEIQQINKLTGVSVSIHMLNDPQTPSELKGVLSSLSSDSPTAVHALSGDTVAGYELVKDIYGDKVMVIQADMPRDIYHQGQSSMNVLLVSRVILGIIFGILIMVILERFVLSRLVRLREKVSEVSFSDGPSVRVPVSGSDELDGLAENVNRMLDRLEESYSRERNLRQDRENEIELRAQFTRALVHELKTPLTPITASSELLAEELKDEPVLTLAKNINRGVRTLNKRVNELLDIASGELKMLDLDRKQLDPLKLLQLIVEEEIPAVSNSGKEFKVELPGSLSPVWADGSRLRQVLINLLDNAMKYTPEGGKIILKATDEKESLVVEVIDTGPGIPAENQSNIFDPYYRQEMDRRRSGLGLGLAICKTIVELHDGRIWVKSEPGKGSTFGFSIPHSPPVDQPPVKAA